MEIDVFHRVWLFDEAPRTVLPVVLSPAFLVLTLVVFAGKSVLSVAVSQLLMLVFRDRRTTLLATLRSVRIDSVIWLFVAELTCYAGSRWPRRQATCRRWLIWHTTGVDLTIPLVVVGVFAFPVCYSGVSAAIVVATLPASA